MTKKKLPPQQPQRVRIDFGKRTRYRPEKDDVPVNDRGKRSTADQPFHLGTYDQDPDDFDEIAGNFGDWGDQ